MTRNQFEAKLEKAGFSAEKFNNNNAWGFGGGIGTKFAQGDCQVKVFIAYFRKGPSELHITGKNPDGAIASPKSKDFDRIAKLLNL